MPSKISVLYSRKSPPEPSPRQIRNVAVLIAPPARPAPPALPAPFLLVLFNHFLELSRHVRNRLPRHRHLPVGAFANDDVECPKRADFVGVILAEVGAPAFLPLEPGARDRF